MRGRRPSSAINPLLQFSRLQHLIASPQVELDAGEGALLQRVMTSLARAVRLARSKGDQAGAGVDAALFEHPEEEALHRAVQDVRTQVAGTMLLLTASEMPATKTHICRAPVAMSDLHPILLICGKVQCLLLAGVCVDHGAQFPGGCGTPDWSSGCVLRQRLRHGG